MPIGRLDADSEGLLLLSDEADWNEKLLHPRHAHEREYWAQVEKIPVAGKFEEIGKGNFDSRPENPALPRVASGAAAGSYVAASRQSAAIFSEGQPAALCRDAATPKIPPRVPPIRFRKSVPDCWIGLELVEGKNRQVRRMTAAIGHPTLRLMRVRIGNFWLGDLPAGQWKILDEQERALIDAKDLKR